MRRANVKIVDIEAEFKPGNYSPYTPVKVVTAQEYDNKNKTLRLSLNQKNPQRIVEWNRVLKLGACLDVTVKEYITKVKGKSVTREYIDFESSFKVLPSAVDGTTEITKENVKKVSLENHLNKITKITFETRKYLDGIDEEVAIIRQDYL